MSYKLIFTDVILLLDFCVSFYFYLVLNKQKYLIDLWYILQINKINKK